MHAFCCNAANGKQAAGQLEAWRAGYTQHVEVKEAYEEQLAMVESQLLEAFKLCCCLAAAEQSAGRGGWDCHLTELFEVRCLAQGFSMGGQLTGKAGRLQCSSGNINCNYAAWMTFT